MAESLEEKGLRLANEALEYPSLVKDLSEDVFYNFVMNVAKYDIQIAVKLEKLKPFTNESNKELFWEKVGVLRFLIPLEDY